MTKSMACLNKSPDKSIRISLLYIAITSLAVLPWLGSTLRYCVYLNIAPLDVDN